MASPVGRVIGLWRYPVKSMQGERLEHVDLTEVGVPGDRQYGLVDQTTGKVVSAKREARLLEAAARFDGDDLVVRLPGGDERRDRGPDLDSDLSDWLGRPVRLEAADPSRPTQFEMHASSEDESSQVLEFPCPPGTFHDLAAVHLLTTASIAAIAATYAAGQWEVARFRPTVLVEVDDDGFVEDGWVGAELHLGDAVIAPFMPTIRCTMTSRAQPGLDADVGIPRAVNRHHQGNLGVYAAVRAPGTFEVGTPLTLG